MKSSPPSIKVENDLVWRELSRIPKHHLLVTVPQLLTVLSNKFLYLRCNEPLDNENYVLENNERIYTVPFVFIVPHGFCRANELAEELWKPLPPSFRILRSSFGALNPIPPPRAAIEYSVVASVAYSEPDGQPGGSASRNAGVALSVTCLPYIEPQPPLEPAHNPGKYVLETKQAARTSFFGCNLGDISFATREPQPLTYEGEHLSATEFTLQISFASCLADFDRIRNSTVKLEPVLQVQSFYASTRMICNPVESSVQEGGPLRIDTDFVRLDKHTTSSL